MLSGAQKAGQRWAVAGWEVSKGSSGPAATPSPGLPTVPGPFCQPSLLLQTLPSPPRSHANLEASLGSLKSLYLFIFQIKKKLAHAG